MHETWLRKASLQSAHRHPLHSHRLLRHLPLPTRRIRCHLDPAELLAPAHRLPAPRTLGVAYHEHRRQVMLARRLGLTKTYNLFHNPACQDADIQRLRQLHAEMDNAILACYGWEDLNLQHDFTQNDRGQTRFMPSAAARREVIFRLMELNQKMAEEEKQNG